MQIEISDTMKKIWCTMLASKQARNCKAATLFDGLLYVNRLAYDFVKEHYGAAAIQVGDRYYTPDCKIIEDEPETATEKRARIMSERS